jgi:ribosomal protein S18 acetylase RimI-like enzyme
METSIRAFAKADIEFALAQTGREGWDATAELFEACLAHDPEGGFIAEANGRRIGMVTTTSYARSAWIGNLIVVPEHRGEGLGRRLATYAMAYLSSRGMRTIRLEADPPGVKIYRGLGFVDEFESLRFQRAPRGNSGRAVVERIASVDLPALAAFDAEHFGDDRGRLLSLLFRQATATYCLRDGGEIRGYAFTVPSTLGVRLGPFVAFDERAGQTLLRSVMADRAETRIVLGVLSENRAAVALFKSHGFARSTPCLRMIHGDREATARARSVFAIANGAMG